MKTKGGNERGRQWAGVSGMLKRAARIASEKMTFD